MSQLASRLLDRAPLWLLRLLGVCDLLRRRRFFDAAARVFHTEWKREVFPHCCTQGGCWAHIDVPACFCFEGAGGGPCLWCRLARLRGFDFPADQDWRDRRALDATHKEAPKGAQG
jgi:hypothetical protein